VPYAEDFDGDGRADLIIYRPAEGTWYLLSERCASVASMCSPSPIARMTSRIPSPAGELSAVCNCQADGARCRESGSAGRLAAEQGVVTTALDLPFEST
jgi:hypothetical protein